jgi:molybdopterin converting factor small subunit
LWIVQLTSIAIQSFLTDPSPLLFITFFRLPPCPLPPVSAYFHLYTHFLLPTFVFIFQFQFFPAMAIKILIPTPLQKFTNNDDCVSVEAGSIDALIAALDALYPGFKGRLCDENGKLRRFLNLYVNSEDIRFLDNQETQLNDGDEVSIVPAVAGG